MQVIPATFNSVADKGWDINDPVANARAGVRYLTQMHEKAGGDPALTAAGYYGGPGAIAKAQQGIAVSDPRNPNAPNTLQYGQQVAALLKDAAPPDSGAPQQAAAPQGNPWDNDPEVDPSQIPGLVQAQAPQGAPSRASQARVSPLQQAQAAQAQGATGGASPALQAAQAAQAPKPSLASSLGSAAWHAVVHPVDTATNIGSAVADGAVNLGKQYMADPLGTMDGAVRGVADGLTFGLADKAAAGMDTLTKGGTYADNVAQQRQADQKAGPAFTAGQLGAVLVPGVGTVGLAAKAAEAVPTTSKALRALAAASGGAGEGAANYLGHNDGPVSGGDLTTSAVVGGALGPLAAIGRSTQAQKAATFLRGAGGDADAAAQKAGIVGDLSALQDRSTQNGAQLGAADASALANSYTNKASQSVKTLASTGAIDQDTAKELQGHLSNAGALNDDQINGIRNMPNLPQGVGDAVANSIQQRQALTSMASATPESWSASRDVLAHAIAQPIGVAMHMPVIGGVILKPFVRKMLTGGATDTQNIASLAGQSQNAQAFMAQQAAKGVQGPTGLSQLVQQAQTRQATGLQAAQQAQQALQAQQAVAQQAQRNTLQAASRMPLSGAYQTFLQGGQSGLNLTSADATTGLRILANHPAFKPIVQELQQTGAVADPQAFYGLTNGMRMLKEQGALGQAAAPQVSQAAQASTPALSAAIANPASYAASVSRNQAMVSHAVSQAPTPQLAMVAHQLGANSDPVTKKMALDAVLAKASDPETLQYIQNYLQPLVKLGRK